MAITPALIDLHHHVLPPEYIQALKHTGRAESGGSELPPWSLEQDLELMEQAGIGAAVLSLPSPSIYFSDPPFAQSQARATNSFLAQLARDHPHRFRALATLPLPDVDAALEELGYALDTLGLHGVVLLANVEGLYQGQRSWEPLYAELDRRKCVVFLHPHTPPDSQPAKLPAFLVDFPFDTTRAVAHLLVNGVLARYSHIRWVLAHAGGAVPFLAERLEVAAGLLKPLREGAPDGARVYLRKLHYDTALSAGPEALAAVEALTGTAGLVFGSDYPFVPQKSIIQSATTLRPRAAQLNAAARTLFPDWAALAGA